MSNIAIKAENIGKEYIDHKKEGNFIVDDTYTSEIVGRSKSITQIKNSWVVADNIEISVGNKRPLWLFGFMY